MIKNKLKELLSELKKPKVQTALVLDYKKKNHCKTFHSSYDPSAKLIVKIQTLMNHFKSMHQSILTKIKSLVVNIELSLM